MKPYKVWRQYFIHHHFASRLMAWFTTRSWPWLKNWQIKTFIKQYDVDMSIAEYSAPEDYTTFTHFFTRHLKPGTRSITLDPHDIACPVDGTIAQIGAINGNRLLQAKKHDFQLGDLLGGDHRGDLFLNGSFATLYLAPRDYHRIHMPCDGRLLEMVYVPGKLFSVNLHTSAHIPRLFARNERVICTFETAFGPMAIVLVGAMFVASMVTEWAGVVTPHCENQVHVETYQDRAPIIYQRGDDIAHFNFGSTVILLFPQHVTTWAETLSIGERVTVGQRMGISNISIS